MADCDKIQPPFSPPDCPFVTMTTGSVLPENAIEFGKCENDPVYVGRVYDDKCYLVGTANPKKGICMYLSKNNEIKTTSTYEILTVDCGQPLEFQPMALDHKNVFVSGGDENICFYAARVIDGENTYIGWADKSTKTVFIPRDPKAGSNKVQDNYEVLIHKFLDRLCICPCPVPSQVNDLINFSDSN